MTERQCVSRDVLADAFDGRLLFAKVREDPAVEIQLLQPERAGRLVIVGSGGCTALSLLGLGACEVVAVDSNRTQGHLIELKAAAVAALGAASAAAFLGGHAATGEQRLSWFLHEVSPTLGPSARAFWQGRTDWVARGVLQAGVTERFISAIRWLVRVCVQSRRSIPQLLGATSLAEQREVYDRAWNNRRWRALFHVLLNRFVMRKTLDDRLFLRSDLRSVAGYFLSQFEHGLCQVPVGTNYFLHHMLTGCYPLGNAAALPPYLATSPDPAALRERLLLVDGSMTQFLKTCAADTVRGFGLSNICEWLKDAELSELLTEVARVAKNGARVVFRNFLGWTDIPDSFQGVFREERPDNARLMQHERSLMQRRVLVCRVEKGVLPTGRRAD